MFSFLHLHRRNRTWSPQTYSKSFHGAKKMMITLAVLRSQYQYLLIKVCKLQSEMSKTTQNRTVLKTCNLRRACTLYLCVYELRMSLREASCFIWQIHHLRSRCRSGETDFTKVRRPNYIYTERKTAAWNENRYLATQLFAENLMYIYDCGERVKTILRQYTLGQFYNLENTKNSRVYGWL